MFADLLNSSYFALFLIVALGFMLGKIKIKGLSLDVSAVIFIALLFGHFGVVIPKELGNFGLVLFIFTIGIQAGPGFFDSFRSKGKTLIIITMLIICSASLTAVGLKYLFDIDTPSVVGLIAGALTSTPGLAVAIDSTNSPLASISYGIAYPFGVIGVILFVKLLPRIMRIDLDKEARRLEKERRGQFPELTTCIYRVTNPAVFNRSLMQINARAMTGAVISRHKHDERISIPTAQTMLHENDYIQAVGSEEALNQLSVLVGEREEGELPLVDTQEIESLLLTKKDMINKQLGDLNLMKNFGCTVTRVRRSGIDLSPSPDLTLKFGDKLMVVGEKSPQLWVFPRQPARQRDSNEVGNGLSFSEWKLHLLCDLHKTVHRFFGRVVGVRCRDFTLPALLSAIFRKHSWIGKVVPPGNALVHYLVDFPDFPLLRLVKGVI